MQSMGLNEIRERFLAFFESKGHLRLSSFSLVPQKDASLLLINSGMAPLKPYFTGKEQPPNKRVTTCQKCIRTPDIESVGKTARHGTFFEMLGNFSFGDYFKKEAISWAWEFATVQMKLPIDKIWVSVYQDDDEAFDIWNKEIGVLKERIVRMGKEDNFWEIGTGPCGPCSELYFDRGEDIGCGDVNCKPGCNCDRFIEFWNLVFTQFNKDEEGKYTKLENPNIDTGMGLERLACIMQKVNNLFEVDTVKNVLNFICKLAKVEYGNNHKTDVSIRVITDHTRSTVMLIADGVIPQNEGRGYVLRRLLRRAARHGKLLGIKGQFLHDIAKVVIQESKNAYPELQKNAAYIEKVIKFEEERFNTTVDQGLNILNEIITELRTEKGKIIPGDVVFKLHDTYGFPLDLTREIAEENLLTIDEEGFRKEMEEQKQRARESAKNNENAGWSEDIYSSLDKDLKTEFIGYSAYESDATIKYIVKDGQVAGVAKEGDRVVLILDKTPFYAESGGQVGDIGIIETQNFRVKIDECKKTADGKYLHTGIVENGIVETEIKVIAKIDSKRRLAISRNHTTTHLLQKALRERLGEHVNQAGSLVMPDRLRFDFTHFSSIDGEILKNIEKDINEKILEDLNVISTEMPIEEAKKLGAMALFGEKYGNYVRVVKIGDYSMEFCGGTHLKSTSQAGLIKIMGETGVAAGVRRIEAFTGEVALSYYNEREKVLVETAEVLKANPKDVVKKAESLVEELKEVQKQLEKLKAKIASDSVEDVLTGKITIKGIDVVIVEVENIDAEGLRNMGDVIKNKLSSGVVVLASVSDGKVNFVSMATKDAVEKGVHCGNIVKEAAKISGGGGGGRPDMAQAGGKNKSKISEALESVKNVIEGQIK